MCDIIINRSAVSREVLDVVLNNSLTGMSFEDIGSLFRTNRVTKYLKDRTEYETHTKIYIDSHKSSLITCSTIDLPKFSERDNKDGYKCKY